VLVTAGSPALLCGVCPWFAPCHVGEEIPEDACWNEARDAGLPFVSPPEPEPIPDDPPANPILARAMKRLGSEAKPRTAPRAPRPPREPRPVKVPKAPKPKRVRTSRVQKTPEEVREIRMRNTTYMSYESRYAKKWARLFGDGPEPPVKSSLIADRPDLWAFAEKRVAAGAKSLESDLSMLARVPTEKLADPALPAVTAAREVFANQRTAQVVASAIRRFRRTLGIDLSIDEAAVQEVRSAISRETARLKVEAAFGDRKPPVLVLALADRPDLWEFAERALAKGFGEETIGKSCRQLSHIAVEDLRDPAKTAEDLEPGTTRNDAAIRTSIRRYRNILAGGGRKR
jgi:hypothetical protein